MCKFCCLYLLTVYGLAAGAGQNGPNGCVLPDYPAHGTYSVHTRPEAVPGQTYDSAFLKVTCDPGYDVVGDNATYCFGGNSWSRAIPQCIRFCKLKSHPSVNYTCRVTGDGVISGTRHCQELEPHGTVVVPECNRPVYYSSSVLPYMQCVEGTWDRIVICQPDCGTTVAEGQVLMTNGTRSIHGELPWHAGIYDKAYTPFKLICGGSLVSTTVVISAHCFWDSGEARQHPASRYAVALGKIYRPWTDPMDVGVQKSNVSEIKMPERFMGENGHYQEDIALVVLSTPVVYVTFIRPICVDFDVRFDSIQLQDSKSGKVTGWGLTAADGSESSVLLTAELPYVNVKKCIGDFPDEFKPYVTSDKICAGSKNGSTVCKGDSGGGLVFADMDHGIRRYYLRGVVSTAPTSGHKCNVNTYTTFTHILPHATFIKDNALGEVSVRDRPDTTEYPPTTSATRYENTSSVGTPLGPDGCRPMGSDLSTKPMGIKSWDKCLEYQEQLIYPCEEDKAPAGGKVRGNYCHHNNDELTDGSVDVKRNEFPHVVHLGYGETNGSVYWRCGGTLISERFILTSARCTRVKRIGSPKYARTGSLKRGDNVLPFQVHLIKRIIKHPDYNHATWENAIALLETTDSIRFYHTTAVPACLDVFGDDHAKVVATGWVWTSVTDVLSQLQKITLTKFPDDVCRDKPPRWHDGKTFNSTTQVCYGPHGVTSGICLLNDGGFLTVHNKRLHCMYTVVGISSFFGDCWNATTPVRYYTRVAHYVPWIESIVWP